MKIGVCGTQGTGKTTYALQLAQDMKKKHPDKTVYCCQENIISCPFPINRDSSQLSTMWIFSDLLKTELDAMSKFGITVTDRTVIDPVVYAKAHGFPELAEAMYQVVKEYVSTYDIIYFLDKSRCYAYDDGTRDTNDTYRSNIHDGFLEIFWRLMADGKNVNFERIG